MLLNPNVVLTAFFIQLLILLSYLAVGSEEALFKLIFLGQFDRNSYAKKKLDSLAMIKPLVALFW
jgi:hypothetical protein